LQGQVTWITAAVNIELLNTITSTIRCISWEERDRALDVRYDLIINLEDTVDVARFSKTVNYDELFGAYLDSDGRIRYTDSASSWFDLSLISAYGRQEADRRKLLNRRTYQEMIFTGLGRHFSGDPYLLPPAIDTGLAGDVAIAVDAGPVWPMKKWAYYDKLKQQLEDRGLVVNILPKRSSLLQHLADVRNHSCLVSGDSLPMHLALGTGRRCVSLFTCTSPWEIYDYGIQQKIVSGRLEEFFYKRDYNIRATTAITIEEVERAVLHQIQLSKVVAEPVP